MILVVGATGLLGGEITRRLLDQGRGVRILVRHNSPSELLAPQGMATSAQSLIERGAQPVYGDLKDRASLDRAVEGIDTVVTTANSAMREGDDNPETVEKQGNRNLVEAAQKAGVKHFIFISANTADAASPVPFLAGKGQTEEALQESGMPYTIIAPNAFMEVWVAMIVGMPVVSGQPVTVVGSGERKHSFISRNDVAAFTIAAVDNPRAINQRLLIGGPEPLSFRDAAQVFQEIYNQEIPVQSIPLGTLLPGLPETVSLLAASLDQFDSPYEMGGLTQEYGLTLTPLEQFAQGMLAAAGKI
jgi:uncharacterized protein YbjT (DUF2867 family)